ncbi:zinc finger protein AZF3-like [Hordeum vulgare subsp. vulgare]|uniref:C2H2-type domain-containing protein n=1 Tax=Hordeum vulgare subsp. vulgare TaxID=112509 RepID=A0A8I6YVM0_HORVV|nr:zinc finger protein AZF3-like [Hordeum vulgare subsp. vulgare]
MMTGSSSQVFIMPGAGQVHYLLAGGAGGGEDPRYPCTFKSLHEQDAVVPAIARGSKRPAAVPGGAHVEPYGCPVCFRMFATVKAVHGHMRSHTDRSWRGMEPPRPEPLGELELELERRYMCDRCKMPFQTRQALGGHRASHSGKKGCSWLEREELAAAEQARKPIVFDVDLNLLPPEAEEQEEEQE